MLNNISIKQWNSLYEEADKLAKSEHAKKFKSKSNHNNILKVQQIQIGDILAIKFYTDLDDEQREFRKSFRRETLAFDNDFAADRCIISNMSRNTIFGVNG